MQHKQYYSFLDGFRAVSILGVLLHHIKHAFNLTPFLGNYSFIFDRIAQIGILGVDMFFVISGFLITGLLIETHADTINIRRFYFRRMFKILPQYFFAVACGVAITLIMNLDEMNQNGILYKSFLSYILFLQNYIGSVPILAHGWSLAVEEHFYLFYPVMLYLIWRYEKNPLKRKMFLLTRLAVVIILLNSYRIYHVYISDVGPFDLQKTHFRCDALLFGGFIKLLEPNIIAFTKSQKIWLSGICFSSGVIIFAWFFKHGYQTLLWPTFTLAYLAPGLFIVSALTGYFPLMKMINNSLFRKIGKNSYGIYLWHYIIITTVANLNLQFNVFLIAIGCAIASIVFGSFMTRTLEKYFLNLRERVIP